MKTSGTTKTFWANRRYDRDPVTELIAQGTTILLNISASPYTIDKRGLRLEMLRSIAMHHRRPIVYVNQVGGDDSLIFDGASMALTADGRVAAQARAFEEDLVLFDTVTGKGEIHEQPHEEIAYAYRRDPDRHVRLRAEMRFQESPRRPERRH